MAGRKRGRQNGTYGAGSVTKLGPGHYKIRVMADTPEGRKQLQRRVWCDTEAEAWQLVAQLRRLPEGQRMTRVLLGLQPDDELLDWVEAQRVVTHTFEEAAEAYRRELEVRGRAPSYQRSVRLSLDAHLLPLLGGRDIRTITVEDVANLRDDLAKRLSPTTVRKVMLVVRGVLTLAEERGWIERNPAEKVKLPRVRSPFEVQQKYHTPTDAELAKIEAAAAAYGNGYMRAAIALALNCGAREGEVCGIRWKDLDLDHGIVRIEQGVDTVDGKLRDTKTHQRRESILLDSAPLREWQEACGETHPDHFVLSNSATPMRPNRVAQAWRRLCDADHADVDGVRFHDLRGEFITRLAAEGYDIRTVAGLAGHSDAAMTLRRYARPQSAKEVARTRQAKKARQSAAKDDEGVIGQLPSDV